MESPYIIDFNKLLKKAEIKTFNEFDTLLKLARNFGAGAVVNKLKPKPNNKLTENEIFELLAKGVNHYNSIFNEELKLLQTRLATDHQPRAVPSLSEKQKLENEKAQASPNYKQAPWLKNLDEIADPKAIRKAAKIIANEPSAFTEQFNNVIKAQSRAELKKRLALQMAPRPGAYQKPKPQ